MRKLFKIFIVSFVAASGIFIALFLWDKILFEKDKAYIDEGLKSFTGAAAVFIFTLILSEIRAFRNRRIRNFTALVSTERLINNNRNIIEENRDLMRNAIKHYAVHLFYPFDYSAYQIDDKPLMDFINLDFMTQYANLMVTLRRHNQDYQITKNMFLDIRNLITDNKLPAVAIADNFNGLKERIEYLLRKLQEVDIEIENLWCSLLIEMDIEKPLNSFLHIKKYGKNHSEQVEKKRVWLRKELKQAQTG